MTEKERRLKLQKEAIEKIKVLYKWEEGRVFTQSELPKVNKNTLDALVNKGVLEITPMKIDPKVDYLYYLAFKDVVFYKWNGKELE